MNRNKLSYFGQIPEVNISRSTFVDTPQLSTSFDVGVLVPLQSVEILPGDTFDVRSSAVMRMSTLLHPTMGDLLFDMYWFFVPNRLIWDHWKEFFGENNSSYWTQPIEYVMPHLKQPKSGSSVVGFEQYSVADYLGVPINNTLQGTYNTVNALYTRAYVKIWNDFFRDENVQTPASLYTGDNDSFGMVATGNTYVTSAQYGGALCPTNKLADYFSTALPEPQKNDGVVLPITGDAEVFTGAGRVLSPSQITPMSFAVPGTDPVQSANGWLYSSGGYVGQTTEQGPPDTLTYGVPNNLYADMSDVSGVSISQLRTAFQLQKFYEAQARSGTRYCEIIQGIYNTVSSDIRLQRAEYLGGARINVATSEVVQTSSTDSTTPQGNLSAYSKTPFVHKDFVKSFTEHGILMCVGTVRQKRHTYADGMPKKFTKRRLYDIYIPQLANISEVPIKCGELLCEGKAQDDYVFGYQQAWSEYRWLPSMVTGAMRPKASNTLAAWNYADSLSSIGAVNDAFVRETSDNVRRTLADTQTKDVIFADFNFMYKMTRPMPVYSVPGLVDHH